MADLLESGARWLEAQRTRHLTRVVKYARGSAYVLLSATIGKTTFEQSDEYGAIVRTESRDFIILAEDLILSGSKTTPVPGDIITDTLTPTTMKYEVMAPGGEQPWRYSDPYYAAIRVHTKAVVGA